MENERLYRRIETQARCCSASIFYSFVFLVLLGKLTLKSYVRIFSETTELESCILPVSRCVSLK